MRCRRRHFRREVIAAGKPFGEEENHSSQKVKSVVLIGRYVSEAARPHSGRDSATQCCAQREAPEVFSKSTRLS
jgi:hypothetical protein